MPSRARCATRCSPQTDARQISLGSLLGYVTAVCSNIVSAAFRPLFRSRTGMYRLSRRLIDAIDNSPHGTRNALYAAAGVDPSHLSRFRAGVAFGRVPAERMKRLGALLRVA